MPIYEFACSKCRRIFNFLSKRVNPDRSPVCPKCGNRKLTKELSRFALIKGGAENGGSGDASAEGEGPMPDLDDPKIARALSEMEREMEHLDESNPRHMARMLSKMKDLMPNGTVPKELDVAIKRLESGEDPEAIEAEMGDLLDSVMGGAPGARDRKRPVKAYTHDPGLYDL